MSNEGFPLKANGLKKHHFLDVLVLNDCFCFAKPFGKLSLNNSTKNSGNSGRKTRVNQEFPKISFQKTLQSESFQNNHFKISLQKHI